ncbi:MAG: fibronectin type III domain-containing protein, partial [Spirochaetaceae bacterium]|nr:fibronectin type III domain-containing protein [Spirochaetaceae bacterium]
TSSGETFSLNLEYGEWTVEVKAYAGAVIDANLAAQGTESFTVNAGSLTISVHLTGFHDAGAGTFKYKIRYPAGAMVTLTMLRLPDLTDSVPLSYTPATMSGIAEISQTVSSVPAGFYLVTALLEKDGKRAGRNEVVHIYRNLASEFGTTSEPAVFRAEDFTADLSDSVVLLLNGPALRVAQGASGQLAVSWDAVDQAQSYKLFISTENDPVHAIHTGSTTNTNPGIIVGTSYLISGLANGTTYYMWASAVSATGITGPKGPFATGTPRAPDRPPESNPAISYTANQGNIRLTWEAVPATETYKVYVSNSSSVFTSTPTAEVEALTYNCTSISSVILQSDTPYYVKVIASNSFGDCPDTPVVQTARTLADEPLSPGIWSAEKPVQGGMGNAQIIGDILRFRATAEPGRTYTVVNTLTGDVRSSLSPTSFSNTANANAVQVIALTITPTVSTNGTGAGTVKVMYYDSDGHPQIAPVIASVSQLPGKLELSWGNVAGATGYNVYRGVTPASMTQLNSDPVVSPYSDTGVTEGTRYYYQVSAVNGSGDGPRSAVVEGTAFTDRQTVLLTEQVWADGEVIARGTIEWYKIQGVTPSTTYYLWFNYSGNGDATKTLSSSATYTIYSTAGDSLSTGNIANSFTTPKSYTTTASVSGTLYLKVTGGVSGTYGIVYRTIESTRPAVRTTLPSPTFIQPLSNGVWQDDEQSYPGEFKWYSIEAVSGETYRVWFNTANIMPNQGIYGDGTKTMMSQPNYYTVVYTDGGVLYSIYQTANTNNWITPINVNSTVTGTLYLKIQGAVANVQTGTYGIVYSTSSVRPSTGTFQPPTYGSISEGVWTEGYLPSGPGVQRFTFNITTPGDYYVHFNSSVLTSSYSVYAGVYDADGNEMGTRSIISSSPQRKLVTVTAPGTYFVEIYTTVTGTGISSRRPYRITYNGSTTAPPLP